MQRLVQATLSVTLAEAGLEGRIQTFITRVARQRLLHVYEISIENDRLMVHVGGSRLDVCVLANAIASTFHQAKVKLEEQAAGAAGRLGQRRGRRNL